MNKNTSLILNAIAVLGGVAYASIASAQSSVTLYGIAEDAVIYTSSSAALGSNSGGKSVTRMVNGNWAGSRFGLKGAEDLGGGNSAIFNLEAGFNLNTGGQQYAGLLFSRQSWVGFKSNSYGTVTAGRQYPTYTTFLAPISSLVYLSAFGAHPGDIDSMDTIYRANNSVSYVSPSVNGFTVGATYAVAGIAGSLYRGSTWSAAASYLNGPVKAALGFSKTNNAAEGGGPWSASSTTYSPGQSAAGEAGVSALTNGYQTAQSQQRFGAAAVYMFSSAFDLQLSYSNVQYRPGVNSLFRELVVFNTAGTVLHWKPAVALDLAVGYTYTYASKANGLQDAARYHQLVLGQYYSLSKRTGLFASEGIQRAAGKTLGSLGTGDIINATASLGDTFQTGPSSSRTQIGVSVGVITRF